MCRTGGPNKKEELEGTRPGVRGFTKSAITDLPGSMAPCSHLNLMNERPGYTEAEADAM